MLKRSRDIYTIKKRKANRPHFGCVVGIAVIFIMLLTTVAFSSCADSGFDGSRVKNPDSYTLDIRKMNGTDSHTLELSAGDALQIDFSVEKGSIKLDILDPSGNSVYSGNGKDCNAFELNISENGIYTISVEAKNLKGSVHIIKKTKA